ncbi:hypothetical protein V1525DRAFT_385241 [Lipomyces kononenkoae]|uniref:Uncharacterized protein n=1 Tax=Lipomyces kononenkoae TaxID=34357 RepID=A0ACC3TDG2_LIPKO
MTKRRLSSADDHSQAAGLPRKRQHLATSDYFSRLSDEALLLIFSYLSSGDLTACASVSKSWNTLSSDSLVWKRLFYSHFVEPRLPKRLGLRRQAEDQWCCRTREHEPDSHWKSLYRLRYNWHRGRCSIGRVNVSSLPSDKRSGSLGGGLEQSMIVRFRGRSIFTVDDDSGLRAWDAGGDLTATVAMPRTYMDEYGRETAYGAPSALHIHTQDNISCDGRSELTIIVGFTGGGYALYTTALDKYSNFDLRYTHSPPSRQPAVTAIVYEYPFLVTLARDQRMNIYQFQESDVQGGNKFLAAANLISSLKSQTIHGPTSLSMRKAVAQSEHVFVTIAYSHPFLTSGWTVGIQEIELDPLRGVVNLRTASSLPKESPMISSSRSLRSRKPQSPALFELDFGFTETVSPPTSLSYSHPFLLSSHTDNTLISYIVKSTDLELSISEGKRLWGHGSGIAGVEVKDRGKAVSISCNGHEIRVWDLESYRFGRDDSVQSVKLRIGEDKVSPPEEEAEGAKLGKFFGFDDEKVVVEQEKKQGRAIIVYDFT